MLFFIRISIYFHYLLVKVMVNSAGCFETDGLGWSGLGSMGYDFYFYFYAFLG